MTAPHDDATIDLQALIRQLRAERDGALRREAALEAEKCALVMELAAGRDAYSERINHQAATIDVLKAMSASPGDPQPVFEQIVERAAELCNNASVALYEFDGRLVHLRAYIKGVIDDKALAPYLALFPMAPTPASIACRAILEGRMIRISDVGSEPGLFQAVRDLGWKSQIALPFWRNGAVVGTINLNSREPNRFTDGQIELLKTFAEQAVIAITSAETYRSLREALEQQTATAEVLQAINACPGDLKPVFDVMLDRAMRLCGGTMGGIFIFEEGHSVTASVRGVPAAFAEYNAEQPYDKITPGSVPARIIETKAPVQRADMTDGPAYRAGHPYSRALVDRGGIRSVMAVPLLRENAAVGMIAIYRQQPGTFADKQIAMLENFASQAVIAMDNARLLTEQREALERQTAMAEVLQIINANPGSLKPVFDAILDKAMVMCGCTIGALSTIEGDTSIHHAMRGFPDWFVAQARRHPITAMQKALIAGADYYHMPDLLTALCELYPDGQMPQITRYMVDEALVRSTLSVPLRTESRLLGNIVVWRPDVRPFLDKEIALLKSFAAQAVIAMENARLLNEVRQRQEELRITFENMGDGVAMFDEAQHLVAWNGRFQEIYDLPGALLTQHRTYEEYLRFLAERGDFGANIKTTEQIETLVATTGAPYGYERTRPDGRVIEIRRNPVPDGGFVLIFSDITERKRSEVEIRAARDAAEAAYRDLKAAQANLIQAEKMASLGQLTAGIAHEIKNPLNFVNNFAALSVDLLDELKEIAAPAYATLDGDARTDVDALADTLTGNLRKIEEHGKRADGIVRSMLEHSRASSGERRAVDVNALVDEALNLAYHGARAQDQGFTINLQRDFSSDIPPIEVSPQDITRVLLNLFSNGFYSTTKRARSSEAGFEPQLKITTRAVADEVEIRVRDNGMGIAPDIRDKLFQPFFTTKPTGEGTGLGLSISYDIITKAHGGRITVDSKEGVFTEFAVGLPRATSGNAL